MTIGQIWSDSFRLFFAPLVGAIKGAGSECRRVNSEIEMRRQAEQSTDMKTGHVTAACGNVFADLGFEPKEALSLQAESRRIIAGRRNARDSDQVEG
ncbi:hypothetical protein [Roseateles albus]|uniref:Uncharacterized protein n=1 Tax=Roseateles albus TaxID=2987525 RepID=A0ABT5KI55_9BURK|nr:hypothetical protein [Roseateles albus]MDC8773545.1 hypothetical protein [Roseateles albus]